LCNIHEKLLAALWWKGGPGSAFGSLQRGLPLPVPRMRLLLRLLFCVRVFKLSVDEVPAAEPVGLPAGEHVAAWRRRPMDLPSPRLLIILRYFQGEVAVPPDGDPRRLDKGPPLGAVSPPWLLRRCRGFSPLWRTLGASPIQLTSFSGPGNRCMSPSLAQEEEGGAGSPRPRVMRSLTSPGCPRPPGAILRGRPRLRGWLKRALSASGVRLEGEPAPGESSSFMVSGPLRARLSGVCSAEPRGSYLSRGGRGRGSFWFCP